MKLSKIYTEAIIAEFRTKLQEAETSKALKKPIVEAFNDIIECIDVGSIRDDDELEDYIERVYYDNESIYFKVSSLVQFVDGEFNSVAELFEELTAAEDFDE
jgi:catabolite regulation protein CreA